MQNKCAIGLDIGERRIGVALSDPDGVVAVPLTVITRSGGEADIEAILGLVRQYDAGRIVAGLPLSMDGTVGKQAERVQEFLTALSESLDISIDTWDERLSTVAAERLMVDTGLKRDKRKGARDTLAAAIILQGYLDGNRI